MFPTPIIAGEYADIRGEKLAIQQTLDIEVLSDEMKGSRRLAAFRGRLHSFHEFLRSIKDSLQQLADRG